MAKAKKLSGEIDAFRAALKAARGRTARSSLYRWLRENHDEFLIHWTDAADWPAFVQAFVAVGLADRTGKPPAVETARKTWLQVRKDVAKAKARQQAERPPPLAPGEIAPGVRLARLPSSVEAPAHIELEIRPAKPRLAPLAAEPTPPSSQPGASASETHSAQMSSPLPEEATDEEVEARLRTLRGHMTANKVPIPTPLEP
jgi:hypothetical protein